jgi:tetratricopeptide (TPR) repeat protein
MPGEISINEFPRDAYLQLLQAAHHLLADPQARRKLLDGLGLEIAERQSSTANFLPPENVTASETDSSQPRAANPLAGVPGEKNAVIQALQSTGVQLGSPAAERKSKSPTPLRGGKVQPRQSSEAHLANELVDLVVQLTHRVASIQLAGRVIKEIDPEEQDPRWQALLQQLTNILPVDGHEEWRGFDCRHPYALTDTFIGCRESIVELDEWISDNAGATVRCIWALGGEGKSALAWHWVTNSQRRLRNLKYEGVLWCSFYEHNFGFENLLRRALAFCGQWSEAEVQQMPRHFVEEKLLEVMKERRFLIVLDGLERRMNGYTVVADRAVDLEGTVTPPGSGLSRTDRLMVDPRDGDFIKKLRRSQKTRLLITSRLRPAELGEPGENSYILIKELRPWQETDAVELWTSILPQAELPYTLKKDVLQACGYHPLVISILARSARRKGGWTEWLDAHRDFNPLAATSIAARRTYVVEVCLHDLPQPEYQALSTLAATGKPMQRKELVDALLQRSRRSCDGRWAHENQIHEPLQVLKELGLVGEACPPGEPSEYDVHPVVRGAVREFGRERNRTDAPVLMELLEKPDLRSPWALDEYYRAKANFEQFIDSEQMQRAWEIFEDQFWRRLPFLDDRRELLRLYNRLCEGHVLTLLPLASRSAQGQAAAISGDLLAFLGDGHNAKILLRWSAVIRLLDNDHRRFLDTARTLAWQMMYEGKLYESELLLRRLKVRVLESVSVPSDQEELMASLECWIGIILALRGDKKGATACFEQARDHRQPNNWLRQGHAEGLVYLGDADEALRVLGLLPERRHDEEPEQEAWEKLTKGIALVCKHRYEDAKQELSDAYFRASKRKYPIIQCFALPYLAEIELKSGRRNDAEDWLNKYDEIDSAGQYVLCAADVLRVRAECHIEREDMPKALDCAQRAYRLAACNGPPFVYRSALERAFDVLQKVGAYVPVTDATLDPQWKKQLDSLTADESRLEHAIKNRTASDDKPTAVHDVEAWYETEVYQSATLHDRTWWEKRFKESNTTAVTALLEHMQESKITLRAFREAFERRPCKSLLVSFRRLRAEQVLHPDKPKPVHELDQAALERWLADRDAHKRAFDEFLHSEPARLVKGPFRDFAFEKKDVEVFLKDCKQRIEFDTAPLVAKTWWKQLENSRDGLEMLMLAECVRQNFAKLANVVREISAGSDRGLTYAFSALITQRAIEQYESAAISRTGGWEVVEVLLRLEDVKQLTGWSDAPNEAKQLWGKLEREIGLPQMLRLAEELRRRGASIADYYKAHRSTSIQADLAYLDYLRHRGEPWTPAAGWTDAEAERWQDDEGVRPSFTDAAELEPDRLAGLLESRLRQLRRQELDASQEAWWKTLEAVTNPQARLRLAEELHFRRASLAELWKASDDGGTNNPIAAVAYLDYSRLNRSEEQKIEEQAARYNREGNSHYENEKYRGARDSYEKAIKEKPYPVYFTNLAGAWEHEPGLNKIAAFDHAIDALRGGLKVFPESQRLHDALAATERKKRTIEYGGVVSHAQSHQLLPIVTPIAVELAANLSSLWARDGDLMPSLQDRLGSMRKQIEKETGISVPGLRFRQNTDFPDGKYAVMLEEVPLASGAVDVDKVLTLVAPAELSELGIHFEEHMKPFDGGLACWVSLSDETRLPEAPLEAMEYIVRHFEYLIRRNLRMFAGMQETLLLIEKTWSTSGRQISDDPELMERFTRMVQALLDENVPMANLKPVCDAFVAARGNNMDELLDMVRAIPEIRRRLPGNETGANLYELPQAIERQMVGALAPRGDEFVLDLDRTHIQRVLAAVKNTISTPDDRTARQAIVVREPRLRRYIRKLVENKFPELFTLTPAELTDEARQVKPTPIELE